MDRELGDQPRARTVISFTEVTVPMVLVGGGAECVQLAIRSMFRSAGAKPDHPVIVIAPVNLQPQVRTKENQVTDPALAGS